MVATRDQIERAAYALSDAHDHDHDFARKVQFIVMDAESNADAPDVREEDRASCFRYTIIEYLECGHDGEPVPPAVADWFWSRL